MQINTTGWEDISIRWDYKSDNEGDAKGPTQFDFSYKVGEGNWTVLAADEPAVDSKTLPPTFQKYRRKSVWTSLAAETIPPGGNPPARARVN
jgi:hypothetical protein